MASTITNACDNRPAAAITAALGKPARTICRKGPGVVQSSTKNPRVIRTNPTAA
ncbi:Uncharacterised protein [Mycobacteroides abscessus subsp. abscessus]|nr:Uncharacterised protein [Mycobacteroides abscessus subsp. abscessus]